MRHVRVSICEKLLFRLPPPPQIHLTTTKIGLMFLLGLTMRLKATPIGRQLRLTYATM
jgi:hypothetical protein